MKGVLEGKNRLLWFLYPYGPYAGRGLKFKLRMNPANLLMIKWFNIER
jgi:hypothetical protein